MNATPILSPNAQQPVMQIAAPLNDVQLVAMLAATLLAANPHWTEFDAVQKAGQIVVEAVKQNKNLGLAVQQAR